MGPFGKPPAAPSKAGNPGKTSSPSSGHGGPGQGSEPQKKATGKSTAKANSAEGGKAFGSPTTMSGVSGTGFDPSVGDTHGGGSDRWSYGHSSESAAPGEWGAGSHDAWEGGNVWERDGWRGKNERGNEW